MAILQNTTVSGSLVITGDLTARQFILSSSVSYFTESFASGSTRFGDSVDDIMQVTGSLRVTGSLVDINKDGQSLRIWPQSSSNSARIQLQNSGSAGLTGANAIIAVENSTGADQFSKTTPFSLVIGTATAKNLHLGVNSDVKMTINGSDGNVGIGITNPSKLFQVSASADGQTAGFSGLTYGIRFDNGGSFGFGGSAIHGVDKTLTGTYQILAIDGSQLLFGISGTEKMRLNTGGYFGINTSPSYRLHAASDECGNYVGYLHNVNSGDCGGSGVLILQEGTFNSSGDTTSRYISVRRGDGTEIGAIRRNGATNVSFDSSSDYRLKEDLKEINGLDKVSQIKVYDFQWKDTTDRMDGVLAHELQEVIPYAVSGVKDEMNGEGKPQYQGVDYSKLVPTLIKAVQELKAENDSLREILTRNNIS